MFEFILFLALLMSLVLLMVFCKSIVDNYEEQYSKQDSYYDERWTCEDENKWSRLSLFQRSEARPPWDRT